MSQPFIYGGNTGRTYADMTRAREIAKALTQGTEAPKNVGEGLNAMMSAFLAPALSDLEAKHRQTQALVAAAPSLSELAMLGKLAKWKTDWENRDCERYLDHYSADFLKAERGWTDSKRRNIMGKDWIKLDLSEVSLFLYPEGDMAVAHFLQDYRSDKHNHSGYKRIYFKLEEGDWRIALERSLPPARANVGRR
jgi:hypothetical protein